MRAFTRRSIMAAMAAGAWLAVAPPVFAQAPALVTELRSGFDPARLTAIVGSRPTSLVDAFPARWC
jgi:hypothetical protein